MNTLSDQQLATLFNTSILNRMAYMLSVCLHHWFQYSTKAVWWNQSTMPVCDRTW